MLSTLTRPYIPPDINLLPVQHIIPKTAQDRRYKFDVIQYRYGLDKQSTNDRSHLFSYLNNKWAAAVGLYRNNQIDIKQLKMHQPLIYNLKPAGVVCIDVDHSGNSTIQVGIDHLAKLYPVFRFTSLSGKQKALVFLGFIGPNQQQHFDIIKEFSGLEVDKQGLYQTYIQPNYFDRLFLWFNSLWTNRSVTDRTDEFNLARGDITGTSSSASDLDLVLGVPPVISRTTTYTQAIETTVNQLLEKYGNRTAISQLAVAKYLGCSQRQVSKVIREMVKGGRLVVADNSYVKGVRAKIYSSPLLPTPINLNMATVSWDAHIPPLTQKGSNNKWLMSTVLLAVKSCIPYQEVESRLEQVVGYVIKPKQLKYLYVTTEKKLKDGVLR